MYTAGSLESMATLVVRSLQSSLPFFRLYVGIEKNRGWGDKTSERPTEIFLFSVFLSFPFFSYLLVFYFSLLNNNVTNDHKKCGKLALKQ